MGMNIGKGFGFTSMLIAFSRVQVHGFYSFDWLLYFETKPNFFIDILLYSTLLQYIFYKGDLSECPSIQGEVANLQQLCTNRGSLHNPIPLITHVSARLPIGMGYERFNCTISRILTRCCVSHWHCLVCSSSMDHQWWTHNWFIDPFEDLGPAQVAKTWVKLKWNKIK